MNMVVPKMLRISIKSDTVIGVPADIATYLVDKGVAEYDTNDAETKAALTEGKAIIEDKANG